MNHLLKLLPISALTISLLQGCASVSVEDSQDHLSSDSAKPIMILVRNFDVPLDSLNVDRNGAQLAQFQQKTQEMMTKALLREINKFYPAQTYSSVDYFYPAQAGSSANNGNTPGNYWILDGKFLLINQGSRALRMFIGLGAGGTKMETAITVTDTSLMPERSILTFDTTGGSNMTVGVLEDASIDPAGFALGAAANAAGSSWEGITDDTDRTARVIAARLSVLLGKQNWIPADKVQKYKELNPNDPPDTTRLGGNQKSSPTG